MTNRTRLLTGMFWSGSDAREDVHRLYLAEVNKRQVKGVSALQINDKHSDVGAF